MIYRYARRSVYGLGVYIALNVALMIIEAIWHPLGRLATWDVATLQSLMPH